VFLGVGAFLVWLIALSNRELDIGDFCIAAILTGLFLIALFVNMTIGGGA
jgi:hypothetical protein